MCAHYERDANRRARFEREARVLASLNHPHIGAIYSFERRDDIHGLVWNWFNCRDAAALIRGPADR